MKFWEATALLTAARLGFDTRVVQPILNTVESHTRKSLRAFGMDQNRIESEFPQHIYDKLLNLVEEDPDEYDRQVSAATMALASRN